MGELTQEPVDDKNKNKTKFYGIYHNKTRNYTTLYEVRRRVKVVNDGATILDGYSEDL